MLVVVAIILGAAALAHTAPFPFLLEAFRPSRSLWKVKPQPGAPPTLYLTFDDGPNPDWTPALLDALRDNGVRATFFLIDEHVTPETAPIVKRMADEGHAIGLHSGTRRLMVISPDDLAPRLRRLRTALRHRRARTVPAVPAARRMAQRDDVRRAGPGGLSPGRLELGHVGLGLVAAAPRRSGGRAAVRKASAGDIIVIHDGHHVDPRADRRHAGRDRPAAGAAASFARVRIRCAV